MVESVWRFHCKPSQGQLRLVPSLHYGILQVRSHAFAVLSRAKADGRFQLHLHLLLRGEPKAILHDKSDDLLFGFDPAPDRFGFDRIDPGPESRTGPDSEERRAGWDVDQGVHGCDEPIQRKRIKGAERGELTRRRRAYTPLLRRP